MFNQQTKKTDITVPKKALVVLLGSAFDEQHERGFGFMEELIKAQFAVDVYSLDRNKMGDANPAEQKGIQVFRKSVELDDKTIPTIFNEAMQQYQKIIIVDGIDFKGYSDIYTKVKSAIQAQTKSVEPKVEIFSLHYIGMSNVNPRLNQDEINFLQMGINFADCKDLLQNPKGQAKFYRVLEELKKRKAPEADNGFRSFLTHQFKHDFGDEVTKNFKRWLDMQIVANIKLAKLKNLTLEPPKAAPG